MGVNEFKDRYIYFTNRLTLLAVEKELARVNQLIAMNKGLVTVNYPYEPNN